MSQYSADQVLAGLKDFQRATVDHVMNRYFDPHNPTRRFLVADETGLGKSVVARGVVASLYEKLQDNADTVNVVYVCSNLDIASQNLARLKVTSSETVAEPSRLALLAKHTPALRRQGNGRTPLNLISFTPGTSFDRGGSTGTCRERAMLFLLLDARRNWNGWQRHAAYRALQGWVTTPEGFQHGVDRLRDSLTDGIDEQISRDFLTEADSRGLLEQFDQLLSDIGRRATLPEKLKPVARELSSELRHCLAHAGVNALNPDLVILDEFQRFRHLMERDDTNPAAELAHHLFDHPQTRVLLLSATPYKPFTLAGETDEDHHKDFRSTLSFLCDDPDWNNAVTQEFSSYRDALITGGNVEAHRTRLRDLLLRVMTRTERPAAEQNVMLVEHTPSDVTLTPEDFVGYAALRKTATAVGGQATIEYWKSAPYFLNFTEGYKVGEKLRDTLSGPVPAELHEALNSAQLLDARALRAYQDIDPGNARLRHLVDDTVGRGWWKLLWIPPSMPYYQLEEPFRSARDNGITKRLLFSSWTATPTAVAGLLSYEAERRIVGDKATENTADGRRKIATRLDYRMDAHGKPGAMSALTLFWPHPELAQLCAPLAYAQRTPTQMLTLDEIEKQCAHAVEATAPASLTAANHAGETHLWRAYFAWGGPLPQGLSGRGVVARLSSDDEGISTGLERHVDLALETAATQGSVAREIGAISTDLAQLGMHSPGNIAWRAIDRQLSNNHTVSPAAHWAAAFTLASGIRSLFNRPDTTLLLDQLYPDTVYWQAVLKYCAAGGLQAVLDEYLHHMRTTLISGPLDDAGVERLAAAAASVLAMKPSTYRAFDPRVPSERISLFSRFALRYGGTRGATEDAGPRLHEVREAFNSPFWPFVVATTSAGQEGIDFHWWCSAVVHWNTPANPVDFEQREGRVHRYGGHAIRRNIAAAHRVEALKSGEKDVWKAAYDLARGEDTGLGDFSPYWVYPGEAKIERHVLPYPLSRDGAKLDQLKRDLALYRLAFGQPRQEDLVALLEGNESVGEAVDLRP